VGATGAEAGLAIGEIEPPQPAEPIVEGSEAADVLPGRLEALVPQAQGLGVVVAEPLDRLPAEGGGGDDRLEGRFRGQHAAGEDVLLDEVSAPAVVVEGGVLDGDDL